MGPLLRQRQFRAHITKYFHGRATKRYLKNLIVGIRDDQDVWRAQLDEISSVLIKYYQDLFSSFGPSALRGAICCKEAETSHSINSQHREA